MVWFGHYSICDDSSIILLESTLLITIGFKRIKEIKFQKEDAGMNTILQYI